MDPLQALQGLDMGHYLALVKAFPNGRDDIDAVLRGDLRITLEEVIRSLYDKYGRCIPTVNKTVVTAAVCDPNKRYCLERLANDFNFATVFKDWEMLFGQRVILSAEERIVALVEKIKSEPRIANLLNGPWYPVLLPKISEGTYGLILESEILPAVKRANQAAFSEGDFVNHRGGELKEQITIVDDRHKRLFTDMRSRQLVGIVCYPLQGFSTQAQRQMAMLMPENFSLLGAMDAAVADAMYPRQLAHGTETPVRICSAVQCQKPALPLCFYVEKRKLNFGCGHNLTSADGSFSGGFFIRA